MRRPMLVLFGVIIAVLIAVSVIYSQKKPELGQIGAPTEQTAAPTAAPEQPTTAASAGSPDLSVDENGLSKATVTIQTTKGPILFKFYPKDAPNTVNRIITLIQTGFYNGLSFHRVVPNFVIQGGDPEGNGTGGSGIKLQPEFNNRKHLEGTLAMARATDPASADSQFYICLKELPSLDNQYTIFGQVIQGMDVVKNITQGDRMTNLTIQ